MAAERTRGRLAAGAQVGQQRHQPSLDLQSIKLRKANQRETGVRRSCNWLHGGMQDASGCRRAVGGAVGGPLMGATGLSAQASWGAPR